MAFITEFNDKIFLTSTATLISDDYDTASWASSAVKPHPHHRWVLAKYVEADNANSNKQYWSLDSLLKSKDTIANTPMNINHQPNKVVGTWTASEMMYPNDTASRGNPYVESLGVFWQWGREDEYKYIENAYSEGLLHVSMECVSETITCGECGEEFAYKGPQHSSYCAEINDRSAHREFNNPTFLGGALILPGTRPGWKNAHVKELSNLTTNEDADALLSDIAYSIPDATESDWESVMWGLQMNFLQSSLR